jgi:23S rRNA pseudouridine2605 synthase
MNLNAYISKSGYCSRRKAALLVKEGKVTVNGKVVIEPWFEVKDADRVKVTGRTVESQRHVYIILNKPKGVTSTLEDRFAAKKITDLIPAKYGRVYPVGRLDKESRGLIVLTNDGDLCYTMTHPKFGIEKEYVVTIKGEGGPAIVKKLKKGVKDEEDILKVKDARILKSSVDKTIVRVVVCEGKKRHLRRLFMRLGLDVVDLVRVRVGGLRLGELRDGRFRITDKASLVAALSSKPSTPAAKKDIPETPSE